MQYTLFKSWPSAVIALTSLFLATGAEAQVPNPDAAILFARSGISGTARTAGTGGAFSSVGADLGAMELNPAGLGLYHQSDIAITPGIRIAAGQSVYDGNSQGASHAILQLAQGGAEWTKMLHKEDRLRGSYAIRSITFAVSIESQSFDRNQAFGATNTTNSLVDNYAYVSNKYGLATPEAQLLNYAGLIGQDANGQYTSNARAPVLQSGNIRTTGAINKINLGFGANAGDKLYLGFSIGIPIINYTTTTQMTEQNANSNDTVTHFQNYQITSSSAETGVGITGKLGLIYKPLPWMRLSISYSLPTWYFMTENYSSDLLFNFDTLLGTGEVGGSTDPFKYQLRTPVR